MKPWYVGTSRVLYCNVRLHFPPPDITSDVATIAPTTLVFTSAGPTTVRITAVLINNDDAEVEDPVFMITLTVTTGGVMVGGIVGGTEYFETLSLTVLDDDGM